MQINNEKMLQLTAKMPMKQISLDGTPVLRRHNIPENAIEVVEFGPLPMYAFKMPYLHRYFAGTFKDGKDLWLHHFLSSDSERHLHNHPFEFETIMLCGNYTEEFRPGMDREIITRYTSPCGWRSLDVSFERLLQKMQSNIHEAVPASNIMLQLAVEYRSVGLYHWHRITHTAQDTWTAVIVDNRRLPAWHFMDDDNNLEYVRSSPREWHKAYNCRPVDGVVVGDNRKGAV